MFPECLHFPVQEFVHQGYFNNLGMISPTPHLDWRIGRNVNRPKRRLGAILLHVVIAPFITIITVITVYNVAFDVFELFCTDITSTQNPFLLHSSMIPFTPWSRVNFTFKLVMDYFSQCFHIFLIFSVWDDQKTLT